ncbi:MAG: hypothetical protein IKN04_08080 [Clostridia bacterium]|nr:hypothetical protein [Clostridia bacterium]
MSRKERAPKFGSDDWNIDEVISYNAEYEREETRSKGYPPVGLLLLLRISFLLKSILAVNGALVGALFALILLLAKRLV